MEDEGQEKAAGSRKQEAGSKETDCLNGAEVLQRTFIRLLQSPGLKAP